MPDDPGQVEQHRLPTWFEGFLRVCNRHTFDELEHFVAADVVINGQQVGRAVYLDGLRRVARGFPDYRWTLQHLLINPDGLLAARYREAGTHLGTFLGIRATGARISTEEVALYRVTGFMITEVWADGADRRLLAQIRPRS